MPEIPNKTAWPRLAIKAALLLALAAEFLPLIREASHFSLAPRDIETPPSTEPSKHTPAEAPTTAPDLDLSPEAFASQTYSALSGALRNAGHQLSCHGNLKRQEKLYPSITQVCWTSAKSAWGIPLAGVSFHFGGEELQFVRLEFPFGQWTQVKSWFAGLPGEDAGTFGKDDNGNEIFGRSMAGGLLMTARPSQGQTVMVIWETGVLFIDRCLAANRSFTEKQKAILCWRQASDSNSAR